MKKLTAWFIFGVVGVFLSFGLSIFTAVRENHEKSKVASQWVVPTPAFK